MGRGKKKTLTAFSKSKKSAQYLTTAVVKAFLKRAAGGEKEVPELLRATCRACKVGTDETTEKSIVASMKTAWDEIEEGDTAARQVLLRLVADKVTWTALTSEHGMGWSGVTKWEYRVARELHTVPFTVERSTFDNKRVGNVRKNRRPGRKKITDEAKDRVQRVWWSHAVHMSSGRKYQLESKKGLESFPSLESFRDFFIWMSLEALVPRLLGHNRRPQEKFTKALTNFPKWIRQITGLFVHKI